MWLVNGQCGFQIECDFWRSKRVCERCYSLAVWWRHVMSLCCFLGEMWKYAFHLNRKWGMFKNNRWIFPMFWMLTVVSIRLEDSSKDSKLICLSKKGGASHGWYGQGVFRYGRENVAISSWFWRCKGRAWSALSYILSFVAGRRKWRKALPECRLNWSFFIHVDRN